MKEKNFWRCTEEGLAKLQGKIVKNLGAPSEKWVRLGVVEDDLNV